MADSEVAADTPMGRMLAANASSGALQATGQEDPVSAKTGFARKTKDEGVMVTTHMSAADGEQYAQEISDTFDEIDKMGNGYITFMQFVRWWKWKEDQYHTSTLSDDQLTNAMKEFTRADIDNSGAIERNELCLLLHALHLDEQLLAEEYARKAAEKLAAAAAKAGRDADKAEKAAAALEDAEAQHIAMEEAAAKRLEAEAAEAIAAAKATENKEMAKVAAVEANTPMGRALAAAAEKESGTSSKKDDAKKTLKIFHVYQSHIKDHSGDVQLSVENMSISIRDSDGTMLESMPYIILPHWGISKNCLLIKMIGYDDKVRILKFQTTEGRKISELMVIQAQEMAKKLQPSNPRTANTVSWDSDVFEVKIFTSNIMSAGTDAQVSIKLIGEKGETNFVNLSQMVQLEREREAASKIDLASEKKGGMSGFMAKAKNSLVVAGSSGLVAGLTGQRLPFQRSQVDEFLLKFVPAQMKGKNKQGESLLPPGLVSIGRVIAIEIGHDGKNDFGVTLGTAWHLDKVRVQDMRSHDKASRPPAAE